VCFALEVTEAVSSAVGEERVGLRGGPRARAGVRVRVSEGEGASCGQCKGPRKFEAVRARLGYNLVTWRCRCSPIKCSFSGLQYAVAPAFRFGPGPNAFGILGALPNPEPDLGSSSPPMPNFELDLGPVWPGSGPNQSSGPNCSITKIPTLTQSLSKT